jgi:hypothetical protein
VKGFPVHASKLVIERAVHSCAQVDNQATTVQDVNQLEVEHICAGDLQNLKAPDSIFEYGTNTSRAVSATHNVSIGASGAGIYELLYTR